MIAEFPAFSKVTLADKQFIDNFNEQFPPFADWAFGTLMTWWNVFDDLEIAQLDGNLIIKSSYLSMGKIPQLTLLGNHNIDQAINTLFTYQREKNLKVELPALPQYTIDAIEHPDQFDIAEDPDTSEYIFSAEMHADTTGANIPTERSFNHTLENHIVEAVPIQLDTLQAKLLLINTLHTWKQTIYKNDPDRSEGIVLDRALALAEDIGLHCIGLFVDKELEGFALYKHLPEKHANINHIKVSYNYPNIFRYMFNSLASHLHEQGIVYMNGEQDLGIEGLRFYKKSLNPTHKLKKYNVKPLN
jgi:hypothetical protein